MKARRGFRFLFIYILLFTSLSTFVMWYTVNNLRFEPPPTAHQPSLVLITCECNTSNSNKDEKVQHNESISLVNDQRQQQVLMTDIKKIALNLKNKLFYQHDDETEAFNHTPDFAFSSRALSVDNTEDSNIIKSLFPTNNNTSGEGSHTDRIEQQLLFTPKKAVEKLILVYYFDNTLTANSLRENECEIDACRFTTDKKLLAEADAVVFRRVPRALHRPHSRPQQLWIYHQLESSEHIRKVSFNRESLNWTATFRSDSTLVTPYGKFVTFNKFKKLPSQPPEYLQNSTRYKTKLAAWFVSNCGGFNGRMSYVHQLQKFAKIDIYGFCGKLKCKRKGSGCFDMLKRDYKFYLAFENSNCRDYITEKFFYNALQHDVVPIVMGAHPDDYKKVAPPNSFIHVDEFNSPRQLAEYIHILDNNDDLYNQYFRWKETGTFINTKFSCRLCSMLQIAPNFPTWYSDENDWWRKDQCVRPNAPQKWSTWKNMTS